MTSGVRFNIYFKVEGSEDEQIFVYDPSNANPIMPGLLVLQASYLSNQARYYISLMIDGVSYPSPSTGFLTIGDLYNWASTQWQTLGTWYYLPTENKIVLYVQASYGIMEITQINVIQALFPPLGQDEFFVLQFNGMESPDELLYTPSQAVTWVQSNWAQNGSWTTDGIYLIYSPNQSGQNTLNIIAASLGGFSTGFSTGFNS